MYEFILALHDIHFQLVFILYGLRREPITSATAKETAAQLKQG